jgi:hypothetical protein
LLKAFQGGFMNDRFKNILNLLSSDGNKIDMAGRRVSPFVIDGFREVANAENTFELEVDLSPLAYIKTPDSPFVHVKQRDGRMILQFYPPDPDENVFTIRILHIFGGLQTTGVDLDTFSRQIFSLLNKNIGSFGGTFSYLGIEPGSMYASLNCLLHFFVDWSDADITNVLSFQLATMYSALEGDFDAYLREASITILKRFD